MMTALSSGPSTPAADGLSRLRARLDGALVLPDDPDYEGDRRVWNARLDRRPAAIVRAASADDVVAALAHARARGLEVAVRAGGYSPYAVADGALLIDLAALKGVAVDRAAGTVRAEAGLLTGELDEATRPHGLVVPTGLLSSLGLAGLTLGGGMGWLMRSHGLTIDSLLAAELVAADGRLLRASPDECPELFWALRGGGGNFGVVTAFTFRAHPIPPLILGGPLIYPIEAAAAGLAHYAAFMEAAPEALTAFAALTHLPDSPAIPAELRGRPGLSIDVCYSGPLDEGRRALAPLRAFGPPAADLIEPMPYLARQGALDPWVIPGMHHDPASGFLTRLDDGVIAALVGRFAQAPSPHTSVQVARMGGAIDRVAAEATAFSHRGAAYLLWVASIWRPAERPARHLAWTADLLAALAPATTGGAYVNALGPASGGAARAYSPATLGRLRAVKAAYDPLNCFRLNVNIVPEEV